MELRSYWATIWRRGWLILLVVAIAGIYVGYELYVSHKMAATDTNVYHSQVTFQLGLVTKGSTDTPITYTERLQAIDQQGDILTNSPLLDSPPFLTQVAQQITNDQRQMQQKFGAGIDTSSLNDQKALSQALTVSHSHGLVTVATTWPNQAGAWEIANAVGEVSQSSIGKYLNYTFQGPSASPNAASPAFVARVLSPAGDPTATPNPNGPIKKTNLILIMLVALVLGIALAFLVDYLDDSVRSKDEAQDLLRVPVYGEVPHAPAVEHEQETPKKPSVPSTIS